MWAFCQSPCDTYYSYTEVPPKYPGGDEGIVLHARNKIIPLISAFYKNTADRITSLRATLYINKWGTVADVVFHDERITDPLRQKLCDEFLKMKGWKPARHDGKPVCARYVYIINCIRWQD
jgi:hypothetical protein